MNTTRSLPDAAEQPTAPRQAYCPTCGERAWFTFLGEQRWPEQVARTLGVPAVVEQWVCDTCHTTITQTK